MTYYFLKRYSFLKNIGRVILLLVAVGVLSSLGWARAQTPTQLAHILTTVVQLQDMNSTADRASMSTGVIIHPDGYILAPASTLSTFNQATFVRVSSSSADDTPSSFRYFAVPAIQLSNGLLLLKIVSDANGNNLNTSQQFTAMQIAPRQSLLPNSPISFWAFPTGLARRVQRSDGQITAVQGNELFSNLMLQTGNIGGIVTTSFDSGALPQLMAMAMDVPNVNTNQQARLLQTSSDLYSYLPTQQTQQLANRTAINSQPATQSGFQTQAVINMQGPANSNFQNETTFAFEDEFEANVVSGNFGQDRALDSFGNELDTALNFLGQNPNNAINTSSTDFSQSFNNTIPTVNNSSNASNNYAAVNTAVNTSEQTSQVNAFGQVNATNGQNILIQATSNQPISNQALVQQPVLASTSQTDSDAFKTFVPTGPAGGVGPPQLGGLANYSTNQLVDPLLNVLAGQPQSGHVSPTDVSVFVQQAVRGGTVNLKAGIYYLPEGIELKNDVYLRGAGKNQTFVVAQSGYHVVKFSGQGNFSAEGISFIFAGSNDANGLHMLSGHVSLSNVRSTNTQTTIGGSIVSQQQAREGSGLLLDLYVQSARIESSEFDFNPAFGVAVRGQVKPLINQNLIHHNGRAGIRFTEQSGGQLEHNIIEDNVYFGIDVAAVGRVQLERNSFRRNGGYGVNAIEQAQLNFANNNFEANGQGEIRY